MSEEMGKFAGVHVAYIAISAAIVTASAYIPMFPVIGAGSMISAGMIIVPIVGALLGPTAGTLAVTIGAFLGQIVAPYGAIFGMITFLAPTIGALVAGLLSFRKWKEGFAVLGLTILMWYVLTSVKWANDPYASVRWYFPFLHLVSLASILILRGRIGEWIEGLDPKKASFGVFFASLAGLMADHMVGNAIYVGLYSGPARVYGFVLPIYWVERLLGAIGATFIGVPLMIGLRKTRIKLGPWYLREAS
jgi:uncharacterized membrane protein